MSAPAVSKRKIVVRSIDTLVIDGLEVDGDVLKSILNPDNRVLWAFIKNEGRIQPVAYDESRVLWLQETDLTPPSEIK